MTAACGLASAIPAASAGSATGRSCTTRSSDGLPRGAIAALIEDRHGTVWAGGAGGLSRFVDDRWEPMGGVAGLPAAEVSTLYEDQHGALWVGGAAGVYRRETTTFELVDSSATYPRSLGEDGAGAIWVTDLHRIVRKVRAANAPTLPRGRSPARGGMASASRPRRIALGRVLGQRVAPHPEAGRRRGAGRRALRVRKQDRRRPAFALRRHGRQHLGRHARRRTAARVGERAAERHPARRPDDGRCARAVGGRRRLRVGGDRAQPAPFFRELAQGVQPQPDARAAHRPSGTLWAATTQEVVRVVGDRLQPVGLPQGCGSTASRRSPPTPAGGLWLCQVNQQGLLRWSGGRFSRFEDVPDVFGKPCSYTLHGSARIASGSASSPAAWRVRGRPVPDATTRRTASSPAAWWRSTRIGRARSG